MSGQSPVAGATNALAAVKGQTPLLSVDDLLITYRGKGRLTAVRGVSFEIGSKEAFGLVGESGSGKSTIALSIMRYLPMNGRIAGGSITFDGVDLLGLSPHELQRVRGHRIAMVYQDPGAALNPSMTVGDQVAEVFTTHGGVSAADARVESVRLFEAIRMPGAESVADRFPHQLSGGMQQRAVIAMALAARPSLLILDEPTTGLDATVEATVLDLISTLREEFDVAILLISHNLAVVSRICDRVGVLYAGELVEQGPTSELFTSPHHPYTAGLLSCIPRFGMRKDSDPLIPIPGRMLRIGEQLPGCLYAPRCPLAREVCTRDHPPLYETTAGRRARCHFWPEVPELHAAHERARSNGGRSPVQPEELDRAPALLNVDAARVEFGRGRQKVLALNDVSIDVSGAEIVGLVGESGSGKSTLARAVAGLIEVDGGRLTLDGRDITRPVEDRAPSEVKRLQMVFQSPDATLNPRQTVRQVLSRTVKALTGRTGDEVTARVEELAGMVQLDSELLDRYPSALSGGQRQRVAIARAFAGDPDIVLCDEPVSNLDVSVQATILTLLAELQTRQDVSYIFISHDLAVVRYLSDRVGVLYLGTMMELGSAEQVFTPPFHPYTETLFAAMPRLNQPAIPVRAEGTTPSASETPSGCPFHTRCPRFLGRKCVEEPPPWRTTEAGHGYLCWIPPDELSQAQRALWESTDVRTDVPTGYTDTHIRDDAGLSGRRTDGRP